MKTRNLLDCLGKIPKSYWTFKDAWKFYPGSSEELRVVLCRLAKQKRIKKILRGYYSLNHVVVDKEALAVELVKPSYISFEYALHCYGLTDQIPAVITLATTQKPKKFDLEPTRLEYTHITPAYFFGYRIHGDSHFALPEKALWDELYLISLGKRLFPMENIFWEKVDKKLFKEFGLLFPKVAQKLAQEFLNF